MLRPSISILFSPGFRGKQSGEILRSLALASIHTRTCVTQNLYNRPVQAIASDRAQIEAFRSLPNIVTDYQHSSPVGSEFWQYSKAQNENLLLIW
jgi:hypothetical protein